MEEKKWHLSEQPFVSVVLAGINIAVYLLCLVFGEAVYARGELHLPCVLQDGEYYRLVSALFLHADFDHILNNMVLLVFLGSMIERVIGHLPYAVLYLFSGVGGNLLSLYGKWARGEWIPSLGASGALFGLDGALLAMVLFLPGYRREVSLGRVLLMIALSLYSGFRGTNIDNAAHVGGLIFGFLLGTIICLIQRKKRKGMEQIAY